MKAALECAQNQDALIKHVAPISGFLEARAEPADAGRQSRAALAQLREGQALDLAQNAAGSDDWKARRVDETIRPTGSRQET